MNYWGIQTPDSPVSWLTKVAAVLAPSQPFCCRSSRGSDHLAHHTKATSSKCAWLAVSMSNGCVAYKAAADSVSFIPKVVHAVISLTFILTSLSDSHAASFQSCFLCCSDQIATSIYCGSVSHSVLTVMLSAAPEWDARSQLISVQSTVMSIALVLPYLRQYDLFTPPVGYNLKHTHMLLQQPVTFLSGGVNAYWSDGKLFTPKDH